MFKFLIQSFSKLFCINILAFSSVVFSQSYCELSNNYGNLSRSNDCEIIAKSITKRCSSDEEKVRVIFQWIVDNIKYDYEGYKSGCWLTYTSEKKLIIDTFSERKGICSGLSALFAEMCKINGIEALVIDGYSRTQKIDAGLPLNKPNHSWNVVKISESWKFVDVTWAITDRNNNSANYYYLFTPEDQFMFNHFPENPQWQMTAKCIDRKEFDSYPYVSYKYFRITKNISFPKKGFIYSNNGHFNLKFQKIESVELVFRVFDYNNNIIKKSEDIDVKIEGSYLLVSFDIPTLGKYLLQIDSFHEEGSKIILQKGILYYNLLFE